MKFALALLALLATSVEGHNVRVREGEKEARGIEPRIVGGTPIASGEFPYYANISAECGGALIGPKVVLTAAHCLPRAKSGSLDKWIIVGGTGVEEVKGGGKEVDSASYVSHPDFDFDNKGRGGDKGDVALIYLEEEVHIDTNIEFDLGNENEVPEPGTWLTVVGVGTLVDQEKFGKGPETEAKEVRKVSLQAAASSQCNQDSWYNGDVIYPYNYCAGLQTGKAHCSGDSGGPLFLVEGNKHIQLGVVASSSGCGEIAGIYASMPRDWIAQNTCDKGFQTFFDC